MEKPIPFIKFDIDETDEKSGIKAISLVTAPAIESNFEFFGSEKERKQYVQLSGYQQVVHGLVLIPDRKIMRFDKGSKQPYYGFFTADVIKKLRNKYHKEMMTSNMNTDHNSKNFIDAYLIESFIIDSPERLADVVKKGMEEATMGSWYTAFKIEDAEAFQRVVDGDLKGFSIEASLEKMYTITKQKQETKLEKHMNKFVEKFQALLDEMKKVDVKLEVSAVQVKDSPDQIQYGEVGQPVSIILPDGTSKLAPAGTYNLIDGKSISVDDVGNLVSVNPTPAPMETPVVEIEVPTPAPVEVPVVAAVEPAAPAVAPATGETKPAVEAAKFSLEEFQAVKASNDALNAQIIELSKQLAEAKKAPLANPVVKVESKVEKLSKEEFSKLSTTEQIAIKNGIDIGRTLKALSK